MYGACRARLLCLSAGAHGNWSSLSGPLFWITQPQYSVCFMNSDSNFMNVISSVIFWEFPISFLQSFLDCCYFCLRTARTLLRASPVPTDLGFLSAVCMLCSLPPDKEVTLPWTARNSSPYNAAHNNITDVRSEDSGVCGRGRGQHAPLCPVGGMMSPVENHCHMVLTGWHLAPRGFSFLPPSQAEKQRVFGFALMGKHDPTLRLTKVTGLCSSRVWFDDS